MLPRTVLLSRLFEFSLVCRYAAQEPNFSSLVLLLYQLLQFAHDLPIADTTWHSRKSHMYRQQLRKSRKNEFLSI
jgi:hypothetical protein